MKALFVLLITVLSGKMVYAEASFEACEQVQEMAVLAKDNMPYWSTPQDNPQHVQSCYEAAKEVIAENNPQLLQEFQAAYRPQVLIFEQDQEFANFLQVQADEAPFVLDFGDKPTLLPAFSN